MKIQPLQKDQWEEMFELLREVYSDPQPNAMGGAWSRSLLRNELQTGQGLGAFDERQRLVGFVLMRCTRDVADIVLLATQPRWRRQGIMTQLLVEALRVFNHLAEIWLEVHESNTGARRLYEKLGFVETGRRPAYYGDGSAAILYTRPLHKVSKANLTPCTD